MRPREFSFPTLDIFYAYINDDTVNESGQPIPMGAEGTSSAYPVLRDDALHDLLDRRVYAR